MDGLIGAQTSDWLLSEAFVYLYIEHEVDYTFHFFLHTFTPVYSSVAFLHARSDRPESVFCWFFLFEKLTVVSSHAFPLFTCRVSTL